MGNSGLPFVDGLAGYAQALSQSLLGEAQLLSLLRGALSKGHIAKSFLLFDASIPESVPLPPPTGGFLFVNGWLAGEKGGAAPGTERRNCKKGTGIAGALFCIKKTTR